MPRKCIVPGCPTQSDMCSHKIPNSPVLCAKWKEALACSKINAMTLEELCKNSVCYRHFSDECYTPSSYRRKLKKFSVPTLYLPSSQKEDTEQCTSHITIEKEVTVQNYVEFMQTGQDTVCIGQNSPSLLHVDSQPVGIKEQDVDTSECQVTIQCPSNELTTKEVVCVGQNTLSLLENFEAIVKDVAMQHDTTTGNPVLIDVQEPNEEPKFRNEQNIRKNTIHTIAPRLLKRKNIKKDVLSGNAKILFDEVKRLRLRCKMNQTRIKKAKKRLQEAQNFSTMKFEKMLNDMTKEQRMVVEMQCRQLHKADKVL